MSNLYCAQVYGMLHPYFLLIRYSLGQRRCCFQLHALHKLRVGVCFKVEKANIAVGEAIESFENMRMVLINTKKTEIELEGSNKTVKL